ncbi:hypothetical protein N480_00760 [Pseudoalteromonas luteoviolacea S2607]|uniref:CU044_2847 family protein n=1 Tax=Pseudoalteromonas luteoviolacea TaxID=43657 RepID=UPI0007B04347|nr:CU044_2847 family protein [Pseudoalteromonas luteoviolacea]KZN39393.1 hypothetical protein N480_00760 [Pseudoalteromonas luteoviolacea S2607]
MPPTMTKFPSENGAAIYVEVDTPALQNTGGRRQVSTDDGIIEQATVKLENAMDNLSALLGNVVNATAVAVEGVSEVKLELGVKLSGETGVVIAKTALEGNLKVSVTWKPKEHASS